MPKSRVLSPSAAIWMALSGSGFGSAAVGGRDVVVDDGERALRVADLAAGHAQAFEGLRAGHFVHEVAVDIDERRPVTIVGDQVVVPDLVVEGTRRAHFVWVSGESGSCGVVVRASGAGQDNRASAAVTAPLPVRRGHGRD